MTAVRIPMLDLKAELESLGNALPRAIHEVLQGGAFVDGPHVKAFEQEAAQYLGVRFAVGVNSGTDALALGLQALGIGRGDEVITTPFTFVATAEAIHLAGAVPVFADIEPNTFNLDPAAVAAKITSRTRAILPVHLYGRPAAMTPLMELARRHSLKVLEDAAQAFGAETEGRRVGAIGDAGASSFFPTKPLGAYGDGGLLTTNDQQIAETARMLARHGSRKKYYSEIPGCNSRLDELQAAVLRVKLPFVDRWRQARSQVAVWYGDRLRKLAPEIIAPDPNLPGHAYHQYTIRIPQGRRELVRQSLGHVGIASMIYYPTPLNSMPAYRQPGVAFPHAESAAREVLSLPIHAGLSFDDIRQICDVIERSLARKEA
jgi:dTDP-4-amino-4,6-dideoxygalactose transaminase